MSNKLSSLFQYKNTPDGLSLKDIGLEYKHEYASARKIVFSDPNRAKLVDAINKNVDKIQELFQSKTTFDNVNFYIGINEPHANLDAEVEMSKVGDNSYTVTINSQPTTIEDQGTLLKVTGTGQYKEVVFFASRGTRHGYNANASL